MDGPTRASKRRKLDTPTRNPPISPAESSTVRKSARSTTRASYKADGSPKEQGTPRRSASKPSLKKANGTQRQQDTAENADVWDDIEGALGERQTQDSAAKSLPSAKKRVSKKALVENATNESDSADELPKSTSKRRGKSAADNKIVSRSSLRNDADSGDHNGLDEEASTPSQRASKRAPNSKRTRKSEEAQDGSSRKARGSARSRSTSEAEDVMVVATPSSRLKRVPRHRFRDDETIPETDEEPLHNEVTATRNASTRRRVQRANHFSDHSTEIADPGEEQATAGAQEEEDDGMSVDGNSVLGSVLDPTEPSPFNKPPSARKEEPDAPLLSAFMESGRELNLLKTIVLDRISGKRPVPLVGLDDPYNAVHQLIEHTVTAGEGNSILLIGARGSGKTALVNKALTEVSKDNGHDYHVVRLNGFIHTDDKIALREIWRQLGKEMELEEENGGVGKSYADALTTLLALLSHPSEHTGEYTEHVAKAVVFVMDEFDLFAQHPRQTLLYNLFDIAQSRKAPIAVLGLTTHIDVANSLEKRVKSRFSHRYVHLSVAKTFTAFQEICKANLLVQPESLSVEERGVLESAVKGRNRKQSKSSPAENVLSQWNSNINVSESL